MATAEVFRKNIIRTYTQQEERIMTDKRKETAEERMNPSLDSPWNKMAVPTTDIFAELFDELREKEQEDQKQKEKKEDKNDSHPTAR